MLIDNSICKLHRFILMRNLYCIMFQPFWGLPKPQKPKQSTNDSEADNEEMVRLKQAQFAP